MNLGRPFKKNVLVSTILLVLASCGEHHQISHEIIVTDTVASLEPLLQNLDKNTLVIFDLDNTIWRGKTYMPSIIRAEYEHYLQSLAQDATTPDAKSALEKKLYACKRELVESEVVAIIQKMQAKKAKVIALTGGNKRTDPLGIIQDYPAYFIAMLNNLSIDFSTSFPLLPRHEFLTLGKSGEAPLFQDGVLFGSRRPKGIVLEAFLNQVQWRPSRIIVFDNDRRMVNYFDETAKKLAIPSVIFEYTGARIMRPFDINAFKQQFQ